MTSAEAMSHRDAVELLPWLVNDSLQPDECGRVMQHAQSCVVCRRELEEMARIRDMIGVAADAVPIPELDMRSINARIDALIEKQTRSRQIANAIREFFGEPWRMAFAVQTIVLLTLGTMVFWPEVEPQGFRTLTTNTEELPSGHFVRVVFDADGPQSDVDRLVRSLGLVVIDGPSEHGVYTLGFANPVTAGDRDTVVERLAGDPIVLFAQPVSVGAIQ